MGQQQSFFDYHKTHSTKRKYGRTTHGGTNTKGHRKEQRPLANRKWHHLTLKSSKAKGTWSFLLPKNQALVNEILLEKAKRWGVELRDTVNMGNHLHMKCKFSNKKNFQNFLRVITCLIARKITGAHRGNKLSSGFWQGLAFTRVLKTSIEEFQLRGYFKANRIQAKNGTKAREEYLEKFNAWVYRLRRSSS